MESFHRAQQCVGRSPASYRQGEPADILGVGTVRLRAYVEKPCLWVRYPDGQENAVLFEDVTAGLYGLLPSASDR